MVQRTNFLKDNSLYDPIIDVLNDDNFSITKYWIKPSYIFDKLENNSKIQVSSWMKILCIFNDYYNENYRLEDLFNIDMLINYHPDYEIEYWYKNDSWSIREWLDRIIHSLKNFFDKIFWSDKTKDKKDNKKIEDEKKEKEDQIVHLYDGNIFLFRLVIIIVCLYIVYSIITGNSISNILNYIFDL